MQNIAFVFQRLKGNWEEGESKSAIDQDLKSMQELLKSALRCIWKGIDPEE